MIKKLLFIALALISVSALSAAERVQLTRYQGERITGVSNRGAFQVELIHVASPSESRAVVEISPELEDYLDLGIDSRGIVKIGLKRMEQSLQRHLRNPILKLTLYLNELSHVSTTGSGSVSVPDAGTVFTGDKLTATTSGSGGIRDLTFEGNRAELSSSGSGSIKMTARVRQIEAKTSGSGRSVIHCTDAELAKITTSGSGGMQIRGNAERAEFSGSGSGTITAEEFRVKKVSTRVTGSGGIRLWAEESLEGSISGSGGIRYKGSPQQVNIRKSGSGSARAI